MRCHCAAPAQLCLSISHAYVVSMFFGFPVVSITQLGLVIGFLLEDSLGFLEERYSRDDWKSGLVLSGSLCFFAALSFVI